MKKLIKEANTRAKSDNRINKKIRNDEKYETMAEYYLEDTKLDDYRVTPRILKILENLAEFKIEVDVCTDLKRSNSLAEYSITAQEDTLKTKLEGLNFLMNCPYSIIMPFVHQAEVAKKANNKTKCLLILPFWELSRSYWIKHMIETGMWKVLCCLPAGQEIFDIPSGKADSRFNCLERKAIKTKHTHHVVFVYNDGKDRDLVNFKEQLEDAKRQLHEPIVILPKRLCPNYRTCAGSFYKKHSLLRHQQTCQTEKHTCKDCGKSMQNIAWTI